MGTVNPPDGCGERRAYPRLQVSLSAEYDAGTGWRACECLNVSPGGARLRCARPPSALSRIRLRLPIGDEADEAVIDAVVLNVADAASGGEISVKFVALQPEVGLKLVRGLAARNRPAA